MNEYLEDGLESLKDISEGAVPPEVYYLSAKAILEHINNLQSKIDKAIEYINTIKDNTPNSTRKDFAKMILINYEFLSSILKEDK